MTKLQVFTKEKKNYCYVTVLTFVFEENLFPEEMLQTLMSLRKIHPLGQKYFSNTLKYLNNEHNLKLETALWSR